MRKSKVLVLSLLSLTLMLAAGGALEGVFALPLDMRTSLTLESNHTAKTKPGESVLLSGWLTPTRLGVSLPIVVEVKNPDGTMDHYDVLTDELGHYQLQVTIKDYGNTYVNVAFSGTSTLRESGSETIIPILPPLGCAIVIAGSGPDSGVFSSIEYLTDMAVNTLGRNGIPDDNSNPEENRIWYMHGDLSHAMVDAIPTLSNLEWAIETWAASHIQTRNASGNLWQSAVDWTPLTIYFAGGIKEKVQPQDSMLLFDVTDETNSISGFQFATFLDNLENSIKQQYTDAGVEPPRYVPINVIIEGPTSGDFIPSLSKRGRIVITSTDSHVRGTGDGGKSYMASGGSVSFSAYFLSRIATGHYIQPSFAYAQYNILTNPALSLQQPQLEATGNAISNEVADEIYTAIQFLEYRSVDARPRLQNCYVPPLIYVPEAMLWSFAEDPEDDLVAVEAVIIPPEGSFEETHVIKMVKVLWGSEYRWEATYDGFYGDGAYTIVFTALDGWGNVAFPIVRDTFVEDTTPPLDVTDLTVTGVFDDAVELNWSSSESPDTQGYKVYVAPAGGVENLWGDVGNVHETNVTGLDFAASSYTFRVTTYDRVPLESSGISIIHVVNLPPEAVANGPYAGTEGAPVTFDASGSSDPDGSIASYTWDFGDSDTGIGVSPTHTYTQDGTYTVTLTVTDNLGATDTTTTTATVDDTQPTVAFSATPLIGGPPLTVTFTDESTSYDGIVSWTWHFGDGITGTEQTPTHTYTTLGTYTVSLTVQEEDGDTDTHIKVDYITVVDTTPPALTAPYPITVEATSPDGIARTDPILTSWFASVMVVDDIDPAPVVTHNAPAVFPLGTTHVTFTATDFSGNVATAISTVTVVDTTPPETTISLSGTLGLNGWYISDVTVTLTATDDISGVAKTEYSFDGTTRITYMGPFTITTEGIITVYYNSTDNAGNVEATKTETIKIDKTPPTTLLTIGTQYVDGIGNIYVTSATEFTLTTTDDVSGVAHTYYRINNGDWTEYLNVFNLAGLDGTYTIEYYSVDVAGNEETPKSATVILVSLKVNSCLTDSDFNPITYFDLVFVKDKSGGCRLVATNPGQFYYNIEVTNDWPISVDTLTIDPSIPTDFVLKGAVPIHIYLDGNDITTLCTIDGNTITLTNVPSGSIVYVTIHVDYRLKGTIHESLDAFEMKGYKFAVTVLGSGGSPSVPSEGLFRTYTSSATLSAHQKKTTAIAGFVTDASGTPLAGATVELIDSESYLIASTVTDENGFYYFLDIPAGDHTVQVTYNGETYTKTATAVSKELTQVDFKIE